MLTTAVFPRVLAATRVLAASAEAARAGSGRAAAVAERNLAAARHASYGWVLISGFFEPVLFLLAVGVGVGQLIGDFTLAGGVRLSYAAFVAPAMLAASAMNGAIAETSMNFFGKMKYVKLYDAVVATPVSPFEIAFGELLWALVRGAVYAAAFLVIMAATGITTPLRAAAALPVTLLIGLAFGSFGMVLATLMRSWQDFDYLSVVIFGMFLFSGTFTPIDAYPVAFQIVVYLTPLYHAVELTRGITAGLLDWADLGSLGYLLATSAAALAVAARRTARVLCR